MLLLFAGVIFSVFLDLPSRFFNHRLGLTRKWAVGVTVLILGISACATVLLFGSRLAEDEGVQWEEGASGE